MSLADSLDHQDDITRAGAIPPAVALLRDAPAAVRETAARRRKQEERRAVRAAEEDRQERRRGEKVVETSREERGVEEEKESSLAVAKASSTMVEKLYDLGWTVIENNKTQEIVICETVADDDMLDVETPEPADEAEG